MSAKSNIFIETQLTARASKQLESEVLNDLTKEETEQSRAHVKELLQKNDSNKTQIHRD